ncbi:MAG: pyridoxamine 5'-phosphate oxidase family protein [Candidatus Heimdallarchaeota archaeon]
MSYTQAPSLANEEIEIFLQQAKIARICTINEDGTIHAVPVWFGYENGFFTIASPEKSRKTRNILKNPAVTLLIDVGEPIARGVIVYGQASVDFAKWDQKFQETSEKYMTKDAARKTVQELNKLTKWAKVTIKTDRIASFVYEKDEKFGHAFRFASGGT